MFWFKLQSTAQKGESIQIFGKIEHDLILCWIIVHPVIHMCFLQMRKTWGILFNYYN